MRAAAAILQGTTALFALCLLTASPVAAAEEPVVVFTVDVESRSPLLLPDQIDTLCADGKPCGLREISRLLRDRGWPATFFLNVYEHREWGEEAMRRIVGLLQDAGHDVALHTHPQWIYDANRWAMHDYSLDEQTAIVRDGVQLLERWTGQPVVAHRAGAYAADERTLQALERNGITLDSSVFWQHPNTRLDGIGLPRNQPGQYRRVRQIPVTAYQREDRPALLGRFVSPAVSTRKIDPDWFVTADEARQAIDAVIAADVPVIVVFMHSFSLMTESADGGRPHSRPHSREMFQVIVDHIARKKLRVATMRDLAGERTGPVATGRADIVPRVTVPVDPSRYLWRRIKVLDRTSLTAATAAAFALAVLGLAGVRRRRAGRARVEALAAPASPLLKGSR